MPHARQLPVVVKLCTHAWFPSSCVVAACTEMYTSQLYTLKRLSYTLRKRPLKIYGLVYGFCSLNIQKKFL